MNLSEAEFDVYTIPESAEILNVSEAYIYRLIDEGELKDSVFNGEQVVLAGSLLGYYMKQHKIMREALDELVAITEELGLYDD